jgi:hypothetical protein
VDSHDVAAEQRPPFWYVCAGCGARYRKPHDQYECEDAHETRKATP